MESEENKIFIEKFNSEKFGFFDLTSFTNVNIGFSVKKKFNESDDNNVTLLSIYIPDRVFGEIKNTKKPLSIHTTYGKKAEGGVVMRENPKFSDPIDLIFPDEYYYDIVSKKFFKKDKEISAEEIIKEVYNKHIKSTKLIKGLYVRNKLKFYRIYLRLFLKYIYIYFYGVLYLVSGILYSYDPLGKLIPDNKINKPELEPIPIVEEVNFLGYKTTHHCIFFYSIFHLYIYFIFINFTNIFSTNIIKIFGNSFSILVYVMFSLIIIDKVLPSILKLLIDIFSQWEFDAKYKTIKL